MKRAGTPLLGFTPEFQMCCMALALLIHCNQCSSQSRACVTEAVCVPLQEQQLEKICAGFQSSRFAVLACSRPTTRFGSGWTQGNVFCTIREIRFTAKTFQTIASQRHFMLLREAGGQRAVAWTFSWLCTTPTAPRCSAKWHFLGADFYCLAVVIKKKGSRLQEQSWAHGSSSVRVFTEHWGPQKQLKPWKQPHRWQDGHLEPNQILCAFCWLSIRYADLQRHS